MHLALALRVRGPVVGRAQAGVFLVLGNDDGPVRPGKPFGVQPHTCTSTCSDSRDAVHMGQAQLWCSIRGGMQSPCAHTPTSLRLGLSRFALANLQLWYCLSSAHPPPRLLHVVMGAGCAYLLVDAESGFASLGSTPQRQMRRSTTAARMSVRGSSGWARSAGSNTRAVASVWRAARRLWSPRHPAHSSVRHRRAVEGPTAEFCCTMHGISCCTPCSRVCGVLSHHLQLTHHESRSTRLRSSGRTAIFHASKKLQKRTMLTWLSPSVPVLLLRPNGIPPKGFVASMHDAGLGEGSPWLGLIIQ